MKGSKYLSELVDCSMFQKGKLNLIEAPTGCGKTYFALKHIPSFVKNPFYKVAFLIDTTNGKEQITVSLPNGIIRENHFLNDDLVRACGIVGKTEWRFLTKLAVSVCSQI